jgi:hypothetical protein
MLEAVSTDLVFTISLKRSTQNLQLSTSSPADYPIYAPKRPTTVSGPHVVMGRERHFALQKKR